MTAPPDVKPVEEQLTEMTYNLCILQLCLQVSMTHLTSKTISLMVEWCCWVLPPMVMVQMVTSAPEQCCRRGWSWPVISVSLTPTTPLTLSNILQWSTGDQSHDHAWSQRAELSWAELIIISGSCWHWFTVITTVKSEDSVFTWNVWSTVSSGRMIILRWCSQYL